MAEPLGKLVHLTRLDLGSTWHGGVVCVCVARVYECGAVSECAWAVVACVTDVEGFGVCVCGQQAMFWVKTGQQQHWRVRWASWCT